MLKLILIRAAPLFFRPAAIVLEGVFVGRDGVLTLALPTAMMALTISSIPVHLSYFKKINDQVTEKPLAREYVAALTWVTILSFVLLLSTLKILSLATETVAWIICFTFLSEKVSDEISRRFEFERQFGSWFLIQAFRSVWLIFPVALFFLGFDYQKSFLISSIIVSVVMLALFFFITKLSPAFELSAISLIYKNIMYLASGFLTASYRQLPRIFIAKVFPEQAHLYLAVAQIGQGAALVFNVRYQIPYRKIIARHTLMFQRLLRPIMAIISASILCIAILYICAGAGEVISLEGNIKFVGALIPLVVSEALSLAIVTTYLGYLPWFAEKGATLKTYFLCMAFAFSSCCVLYYLGVFREISILEIPALMIILGTVWVCIIIKRHFITR